MVVFYTTHCPKCQILEKKLKQKKLNFIEENNIDEMLKIGLTTVPWLDVDGEMMDFNQANQWINEQ